jgi:hypothetical protein
VNTAIGLWVLAPRSQLRDNENRTQLFLATAACLSSVDGLSYQLVWER